MARHFTHRRLAGLPGVALALMLAACGPAALPPGDTIIDADEAQNREVHRFNVALDRSFVRPVAQGYGTAVPGPIRQGVDNFASNLAQPSYVLNNILQVRLGQATHNTLRFLVNSTIGIGGLFDPATALGLEARETDFGETLHIYGAPEGDFVMLPVFGPSTTRDTMGLVVDMATNPASVFVSAPQSRYVSGSRVLDVFGERYDNRNVIDGVLYDSADGYAQLRSLYLQNRRFQLGGPVLGFDGLDGAATDAADIYTDPYADAPVQ
ncbi:VacJ family lipoprotein [Roseicyclus marinus]|uniref:MlaA family lipoprotein n=1 Tax=Roseicyclus marinus TaxID=2161673 RepID=UPI00240F3FB4|nr:VacJ family lipoprotein [Roseicyclus marinus]MDG3041325.1 VacJ family lipoprotein [Roseicyclus marinus]